MDQALLASAGAQTSRPSKHTPLAVRRIFTGLYTNRNPLMEPGSRADTRFYGGHPDTLIGGLNTEVSTAGTLVRRPGFSLFCTLPSPAKAFYAWQQLNGTLTTLADTATAVYQISQGSYTSLFTKGAGAGQSNFQSVGSGLYWGDGAEVVRYDGTTVSPSGIVGPDVTWPNTGPTLSFSAGSAYTYQNTGWSYVYAYATAIPGSNGYFHCSTASYPSVGTGPSVNYGFGGALLTVSVGNGGSGYNVGDVLNVLQTSGPISTLSVTNGGSGYIIGDVITIVQSGASGAAATVLTLSGSAVASVALTSAGTGYSAGATTTSGGSGTGCTLNITAVVSSGATGATVTVASLSGSAVAAVTITNIGSGYSANSATTSAATGGGSGCVLTISAVTTIGGFQVGVQGYYSTNTQVACILIFRTVDGGSSYLYLAALPNNTAGGTWNYTDNAPDVGSSLSPNPFIPAPVAQSNNAPPTGLTALAFWSNRLWGAVGNYIYYAAGPDCLTGDGNSSWPPLNYFQVTSAVKRLVPYPNGLLVYTINNVYVIRGTCSAVTAATTGGTVYNINIYQTGIGIPSYNAIDTYGSAIYTFNSDKRVLALTPGSGVSDYGAAIGDQWLGTTPANVSVTFLNYGYQDQALFVCDGQGNFWRCNPNQMPEGTPCWSTQGSIAAGATLMAAVETSPGVKQLLVASGNNVLRRDWTVGADNSAFYPASAIWGSIVLAAPGRLAEIDSLTVECKAIGSIPTVSVLCQEINQTAGITLPFVVLEQSGADPSQLAPSKSLYSRCWYLSQDNLPSVMRHLQIQIAFPAESAANEMLGFSIYGALKPK